MKKPILYTVYAIALFALLYFDKVLSIAMSTFKHVTSPITCAGILLFGIGIAIIILRESLSSKDSEKPYRKPQVPNIYPLYNDHPNKDDTYGRDDSAKLLISKIFSTFNEEKKLGAEGSLVININEAYGYGKTTFLKILEGELQNSHAGEYYFINYRPWLCDSEKAIIRELFMLLSNSLGIDGIRNDIHEYLYMLLLQSEQIAPSVTKPFYALMPRKLKDKTLQELHDDIKKKLQEIEHPIIITIDDVDRLHDKELVAVLKLIRDTADFPNIFYILAADNAHLGAILKRQGIEQPYKFLQKFFNLDYLLPAHENVPLQMLIIEMGKILKSYGFGNESTSITTMKLSQLNHLNKVFTNMRDVYRFLNVYTSSLDILRSNKNLECINTYELFYLTIIRHLCAIVYKILRDRNDEFLEVVTDHQDERYKLKDGINLMNLLRCEEIGFHFDELEYKKDPQNHEKPERPKPKSEGLTLETAIQKTKVTRDIIVFNLLDLLFGNVTNKDKHSICRCNNYFIYFSGRIESNKLTIAQVINILKMEINDYEKCLDKLFEGGKNKAFIGNFDYAYIRSGISREDAMKKAYIYLEKKYYHTESIDHKYFETFENYVNGDPMPFMYYLYALYGKNHNSNIESYIQEVQTRLEEFCKTEEKLHMLVLAFYLISQRSNDFCFDRVFINNMLIRLADRFINERMEGKIYSQVEESTYDIMYLFKDEFATNRKWVEKFEDFICQDVEQLKQWLSSIIRFYPDGNIDWNNRHRNAVIGEGVNASEKMLDDIKLKFPDCSEAIEELIILQHYPSLRDQEKMGPKFIQMAHEKQN